MLGLPSPFELILILVFALMLFGVGKLPEVFGAIGKGFRDLRQGFSTEETTKNAR